MNVKKILIILLPVLLQAVTVWSNNIHLADTLDMDDGPVKLRSLTIPLLVDPAGDNRTGDLFRGGVDDGFATSCLTPVVTEYGPQLFECVQDSIVLWIKAVGTDREYRWQKYIANDFRDVDITDGRITGHNTDRMVIRNVDKAKDDGVYRCLVSNGCGDTPSDTFRVVMNSAPYFLARLGSSMTWECVGPTGRNLAVVASCLNEKMLTYTWSKRDTVTGNVTLFDLDKNNKSTLTVIPRSREDEGEYIVEVSNECGSVRDSVFMPVYMPVSVEEINIKDRKIIACAGESADFQVKVAGGGVYTYVLKKVKVTNTYPLVYQVLSVVDTGKSQVTINGLKADRDAGWYLWEVTNNCGKDTSEVFELIVHERPLFKKEFPDTLACEGSDLVLSCEAEGIGVQYYWYHNGEPTGVIGNTFQINGVKPENTGIYTCYAHNVCAFHPQSRPIEVEMDPLPQILRQPFLLKPACVGDSVVEISVRFASAQVDSLRWRYNDRYLYDDGVKIEGSTDPKLSIYHISMEEIGHYYVQAYNKCGSVISESAMLQINEPAAIIKGLGGYDMLLCSGADQQLSVKAKGALPIHYRWLCNERVIAESDTNFVDIKSGEINADAEYCVQVENMCGGESHCSHLRIAKIKTFDLEGGGAYCDGHEATGAFNMVKSDTNITYTLYREPGDKIEEFKGTGDTIKFEEKSSGTYYITGLDSNGCVQRMNNPVMVELKPSPAGGRLLMIDEYCMGSAGANLLMTNWEKDIQYKLYRKYDGDWEWYKYLMFIGGNDRTGVGSPAPGEQKEWEGLDEGRYKVVAMNLFNGCSTEMVLPDSVQLRPAPRKYSLSALNGDYINCSLEAELTQLRADGYENGSSYTLLKDGSQFGQILRYSPIQWGHIDQGEYKLAVKNQWGCVSESRSVKILNINSPAQVKLGGSGAICDGDTDRFKELTILNTEPGAIYKIYKDFPETYVDKITGTGNDESIIIPAVNATYIVDAYDATGNCKVRLEDRFTIGASNFQAVTNPPEIFLDRGGRAHLHLDVKGSYAEPITIEWKPKNMIEWGLVSSPTTQIHKQYYRPFCPCGCPSEGDLHHEYVHGPQCEKNPTKCPYIYHTWDPAEHGCVYQGTERIEWRGSMVPHYDLYFCKKQIIDDSQVGNEDEGLANPYKDPVTVPIYQDITYEVTTTDALGCSKTDEVKVKITGKRLDAEIIYSEVHKHYYVPFCPCGCSDRSGYRHPHHGPGCNDSNCWYFYHNHKHEGCTFQKTEKIFYNGSWRNYYDFYYCCTGVEAADTIVYRNDEQFFCSSVDGGDYTYRYTWTFVNEDGTSIIFPDAADRVQFRAKESGYLYLDVTSMGQHKKDSIWIEVQRKPLEAHIKDSECVNRLDSVSLCVGERVEFCGWAEGGDGPHTYRWFDKEGDLAALNHVIYKPEKSGYVWFVTTSDGIEVRDSVYVKLSPSPKKVDVVDPGLRCVQIGQEEFIKIPVSQKGVNYVLEHRPNNYENQEYGLRYNNATGGPVVFQIMNPVQDAGMFKVRVDTIIGDKVCSTYLDSIEFVAPPSDAQFVDSTYCFGEFGLKVRLKSVADSIKYTICSSIGTPLETIEKPKTEFTKLFTEAGYIFRTERVGDLGTCKVDRNIHISRAPDPDISLAVEANAHGEVCEGSEILITVKNTEKDVRYELIDPTGESVDVFTGDGRDLSFTAFPRPAGIYMIQATKKNCSRYLDNTVRVNKLPTNVEIPDIHYCFSFPQKPAQISVPIELSGLQTNVAYYLKQKTVYLDTLEGPGRKSYKPRSEGEYQIVAKDKVTKCISPVSTFKIVADEGPYPFQIEGGCGAEQEVKIPASQKNVTYSLLRDNALVAQKAGTGDPLSFGLQRISGIYQILGTNDTTACETFMKGTVDIYELDTCDLKVIGSICNTGGEGSVELQYPCSKSGWSYFIQTVRAGRTVRSEILPGTGGELWWNLIDNKALKEGTYELWAANKCDTIKVKSVEVLRRTGPVGKIMPIVSACRDQEVEVMVTGGDSELNYTLFGDVNGYSKKLYETIGSTDNFSMGSYANYKTYRLAAAYPDGSCYKVFTLATVKMSETPNPIDILGQDICKSLGSSGTEEGAIEMCLPRKEDKVNYYLLDGSRDTKVDSIMITDPRICFELQKDTGCYYVWAKHSVTQCQDTMNGTYCLSSIPQPFAICVDSVMIGLTEIDMCVGQSCGVLLLGSAKGVQYQLYLNGTTPVGKPKIGTGSMLLFDGITAAGVYTVKGFNGCGERLMNLAVTVRVGDYPDMHVANPYYYCPDQPGAVIEVFDTERGSKFDLYRLENDWTRTLLESKESTVTGSTLTFAERGRENINYLLTAKTRYGCKVEKTFTVKRDTLPKDNFILSSTNNATTICEATCTELTLSGSEKEVEYYLYNVDKGEQAFLMGEGGPINFGKMCEPGVYYVEAYRPYYPRCNVRIPSEITLRTLDTIRELKITVNREFYCNGDMDMASLFVAGSQGGIEYQVYKNGRPTGDKIRPNASGTTLKFAKLEGGTCDEPNVYTVKASNAYCSKFMLNEVRVVAENALNVGEMKFTPERRMECCEGDTVSFKIMADGCNLKYTWWLGATQQASVKSYLTLENVKAAQAGIYTGKVENSCNKVDVGKVELSITPRPKIAQPMPDVAFCEGHNAYVYSMMDNVHTGNYKWYRTDDGRDTVFSREPFLEFAKISKEDAGEYVCEGSSECYTVKDTFMLAVDVNTDSLRINKLTDTLCVGSAFSAEINTLVPYDKLTWNFNGISTGVKGYVYPIGKIAMKDDGIYSVTMDNACGLQDVVVKQLIVDDSIKVLDITPSMRSCAGVPVDLYIKTNPTMRVDYNWYEGQSWLGRGEKISTVVGLNEVSRTYRVYYSNRCGTKWSDVNISINGQLTMDTPPAEILLCADPTADTTLCVKVHGVDVSGYQWLWQKKGSNNVDSLGTASCETIRQLTSNTGFYWCSVKTECRPVSSPATWLKIDTVPVISDLPAIDTLCIGGTYNLSATAVGGGGMIYDWKIKYKDGREELLFQDEGKDFTSTSVFQFGPVTEKYDSAWIWCVSRNNCGEDFTKMFLRVDKARELIITPYPDTTICEHSYAQIRVELKNGVYPWAYSYRDTATGVETFRNIASSMIDILDIERAGVYDVLFLRDGKSCNYADGNLRFKVNTIPAPTASISVVGPDTLCPGEKARVKVEIKYPSRKVGEPIPDGPWEVKFIRRDGSEAVEMGVTNPYYIYKKHPSDTVVIDTLRPFTLTRDMTYYIGSIKNAMTGAGDVSCPGQPEDSARFILRGRDTLKFDFRSERDTLGYCNSVLLDTLLNPNMDGDFYIDGIKSQLGIFNSPPLEPGRHIIKYHTYGRCPVSNDSVRLWVMPKPKLKVIPRDTALCPGSSVNITLSATGVGPFKLKYELRNIKRDGSVNPAPVTSGDVAAPKVINVANTALDDSVRIITPLYLKDRFDCWADKSDTIQAIVEMRKYPEYEVYGMHGNYDDGKWADWRDTYVIPDGDSVNFKIELQYGGKPWKYSVVRMGDSPQIVGPVSGSDTTCYKKTEGQYTFTVVDRYGCSKPGKTEIRNIFYKEPGYVRIKMLLEGAYNEGSSGKPMSAGLQRYNILPKRGLSTWPVTGTDSIVDWVVVEVREEMDKACVASDTFLLRNDGQVIDVDGNDTLGLQNTTKLWGSENQYIVIKHRNHVSVMTKNKVKIVDEANKATVQTIDFTQESTLYCPPGSTLDVHAWKAGSGLWGLAAGYDLGTTNGLIPDNHLVSISNPNAAKFAKIKEVQATYRGYYWRDVTLDGIVQWPEDIAPGDDIFSTTNKNLYKSRDAWILHKNRNKYSAVPYVP